MRRVFAPQAAPWELVSGLCWPGSRSCSLSRQRQVLRCHGVWMMLTSVNSRSIMSELGIIDPRDAPGEYSAQARPRRWKARLSSLSPRLCCELPFKGDLWAVLFVCHVPDHRSWVITSWINACYLSALSRHCVVASPLICRPAPDPAITALWIISEALMDLRTSHQAPEDSSR